MKPKRLIEALVMHIARLVDGSMLMERRAASEYTHRHGLIGDAGETTG
jgi:hypothetical protein